MIKQPEELQPLGTGIHALYVFSKLCSFTEYVLKIKYVELFISRFVRCKDSLNEHSSVNIYRLYLPSNAQVIFNRALILNPQSGILP